MTSGYNWHMPDNNNRLVEYFSNTNTCLRFFRSLCYHFGMEHVIWSRVVIMAIFSVKISDSLFLYSLSQSVKYRRNDYGCIYMPKTKPNVESIKDIYDPKKSEHYFFRDKKTQKSTVHSIISQ